MINAGLTTYGLIGKVLGHSYSYRMFNEKFQLEGIDAEYRNFEIPDIGCVRDIIADYPTLRGFNVTIPYKTDIIQLLSGMSDEAREIGAVNVVKRESDGRLMGYNTDVIGFMESVRPHIKHHHKHALILGTGGVSKAVAYGLKKLGISYQFVSRNQKDGAITYGDITESMVQDAVIVNCTPLGMYPNTDDCPDIPYYILRASNLLFDCIANPDETLFMRRGREQGATAIGGSDMLRIQAEEAWKIWSET